MLEGASGYLQRRCAGLNHKASAPLYENHQLTLA